MTEKYELSRRKALIGLGTIGVAGAGAGMGTSALFSDEEEFENNSVTAGTLDMEVVGQVAGMSDGLNDAQSYDIGFGSGQTVDGAVAAGIQVQDMKPGDWIVFCFEVTITENPGYLLLETAAKNGDQATDAPTEGGGDTTEPEPTPDDGELAENMLASFYDGGSTLDASSIGDGDGNLEPTELANNADRTRFEDENLLEVFDGPVPAQGGFNEGVILRGPSGDFETVGSGGDWNDTYVFYTVLEIPEGVTNEIQGDTIAWDLYFETQQVRNNPNPFQ